jgi:hypothetical protein
MKTASLEIDSLDVKVKPNGKMTYEEFLDWCDEDKFVDAYAATISMDFPTRLFLAHRMVSLSISLLNSSSKL